MFFVIITMIHDEYIVLFGEFVTHMRHPQLQEKGGSYAPGLVWKNRAGAEAVHTIFGMATEEDTHLVGRKDHADGTV
jgi:hypothetical protein